VRLFLAVTLPEEIKNTLGLLIERLTTPGSPVKWVKPDNIHLTLKFLGEVEEERVQAIHEVSRLAVKEVRPFKLRVEEVGAFPSLKRPRVIWVGIKRSMQLATLHGRIEGGFQSIGFPSEKRPWAPHLTIGRVKGNWGTKDLVEKLAGAAIEPRTFFADSLHLIQSVLKPEGPIYTTLREIPMESGR
jgi:2'-5' RNA ligase